MQALFLPFCQIWFSLITQTRAAARDRLLLLAVGRDGVREPLGPGQSRMGPHFDVFLLHQPWLSPILQGYAQLTGKYNLQPGESPWKRKGGDTFGTGCWTSFEATLGLWKESSYDLGSVYQVTWQPAGHWWSRTLNWLALMKEGHGKEGFTRGACWDPDHVAGFCNSIWWRGALGLGKDLCSFGFQEGWFHPPHQPRNHKASFLPHHSASYSTHPTHFNRTRKRGLRLPSVPGEQHKANEKPNGSKNHPAALQTIIAIFHEKLQSFSLNGRFLSEKSFTCNLKANQMKK